MREQHIRNDDAKDRVPSMAYTAHRTCRSALWFAWRVLAGYYSGPVIKRARGRVPRCELLAPSDLNRLGGTLLFT